MTYSGNELATYGAQPIELYRFYEGTRIWTFTSAEQSFTYEGEVYEPAILQRTAPEQSKELRQTRLTITCNRDFAIAKLFRLFIPASTVWLTIYRAFRSDLTTAVPYWQGRIRSVVQKGGQAQIEADPLDGLLKRNGLRGRYQATCNHILYGTECGAIAADFKTVGNVASVDGLTVSVPEASEQADGYYVNGLFERPSTGDYRMIVGHTGDLLTLTVPFEDLAPGEVCNIYAGCDRTVAICKSRFDNFVNYGGFPTIPVRNPYAGSIG